MHNPEKERLISLHNEVLGYKKIKEKTGFYVYTIRNVIRKWNDTGTVENKSRSGRAKVTTAYTDRVILR